MSLADEIARTLPVPARIVRLPDGPAERPDLTTHHADPRETFARLSGAPAAHTPRAAEQPNLGRSSAWRTGHARPTPHGDGYTLDTPATATGPTLRDDTLGVVTFPADAHDDAHIVALHTHRCDLARAACTTGEPQTFAWTRPDGSRVEWTAEFFPRLGVVCSRDTTVARPTLARLRAQRSALGHAIGTAHGVLKDHAASAVRLYGHGVGWSPVGTYTGHAAVTRDAVAALAKSVAAETHAAREVSRLRDARRSVERAHDRAAKLAAMTDDELAAHKARAAARQRASRARRRSLDFAAAIARLAPAA